MENVKITGGGIKCDNPDCGWRDDTVTYDDYERWLNAPCPKCGENLLTKEDYDNIIGILETIKYVNSLSPEAIEEVYKSVDVEMLKENQLIKDATGLENLSNANPDELYSFTIDSHNGVKISDIKPVDVSTAAKEAGFIDWNTLSLDQMADYLEQKYEFLSSGEAKCIFELINFYRTHK